MLDTNVCPVPEACCMWCPCCLSAGAYPGGSSSPLLALRSRQPHAAPCASVWQSGHGAGVERQLGSSKDGVRRRCTCGGGSCCWHCRQ